MMRYCLSRSNTGLPSNPLHNYTFVIRTKEGSRSFAVYFDAMMNFELSALSWCREKFGEEDRSGRWHRPRVAMITIRDENDAMAFQLKFG